MKIQVVSDTHLEFHKDHGKSYIDSLCPDKAELLIIAGDWGSSSRDIFKTITEVAKRFQQVIYVPGNHDHYHRVPAATEKMLCKLQTKVSNLHILNPTPNGLPFKTVINGWTFYGAPLWFADDPLNAIYKKDYADFEHIPEFEPWVYEQNELHVNMLKNIALEEGKCVVITHFLPTRKSVSPQYAHSNTNRFFVCDAVEEVFFTRRPTFWIHGHTHDSKFYRYENTQVVCNPFGYPHRLNPQYNPELILELTTG